MLSWCWSGNKAALKSQLQRPYELSEQLLKIQLKNGGALALQRAVVIFHMATLFHIR